VTRAASTASACVVRVPASSANLGPGFDCLAAALDLRLELRAERMGSFSIASDVDFVPLDRTNLCVRAFEQVLPADGVSFTVSSEIPLAAGLGSSAAAIVAGTLAARALAGADPPVLTLATSLEGHPDNVAAALLGGIVVVTGEGEPERLEPPPGLGGVLVVPPRAVPTALARAALPAEVPMADAVHNVAHAAVLALGLARGDLEQVARGLSDRLHQPRREALYPGSMDLVRRARGLGALGATISGAGPTVLVWAREEDVAGLEERLRAEAPDCTVRAARFAPEGARVDAGVAALGSQR
jgi:homoserine kinase